MRVLERSSPTKLGKCLTVFAFGLAIQVAILFLAVPGKALSGAALTQSAIDLPSLPLTFSVSVSSRANVAVDAPYILTYTLVPSTTVVTDTLVAGRLDLGQRLLGILANQGDVVLGNDDVATRTYTVTLKTLSPDFPLIVAPEVIADISGTHRQLTAISGLTAAPIVISDLVVAQDQLAFDVFRTYPGVVQQGDIYTATWQVGAAGSPLTDTLVAGELFGGVYLSVIGQPGQVFCERVISSFTCSIPVLAVGESPVIVTYTSQALEIGRNDHVLQLLGGGESLTVTTTATVLAPPLIEVPIDIKPGGFPNPINPKSHGNIPVAILSTASFNVFRIDQASLAFGPNGTEESLLFCNPEDSNADGLIDIVCHFDTQLAGFQRGDTEGLVTGFTFGGTPIHGSDSVFIVPKNGPKGL